MATNGLATATRLALGIGDAKRLIEVADLAHASRAYRAAVVASGRGYSRMAGGWIYDLSTPTPKRIARVSYNGCVWPLGEWTRATQPLFDPAANVGAL